jgi:RNA polymerase sigma-70 factor (ECF subfamily)
VEQELADLLASRDLTRAGTVALRSYGPEIMGLLVTLFHDERVAGDVFSQFCEDLWTGIGAFRGASSFRTWAYALAHHAAFRYRRDPLRRRGIALDDCPEVLEAAHHIRTTTLTYMRTEVKDRVRRLREKLTTEEQTLLVLRVDRGMSWEETAEIVFGEADAAARARHVVALRKRFERTKERLRALVNADAENAGAT